MKSTVATKRWWSLIALRGVITSSLPERSQPAERPFTRTLSTESPAKSRLKLESDWVARAIIVTSPSTVCSGSAVG